MIKDLICIICPNGCKIHGELSDDGTLTVTGNRCKRGEAFAGTELTDPTRSLTTTVKTTFANMPYLPVRTQGEIPKYAINDAIVQLSEFVLDHNVSCGDVIIENIAGTNCPVIATLDL
ncbi:MAG: DUF1667 domain-containing protein [Anaerovoracaceae bacterium]